MAKTNNSINIPEAREAMNKFKMEAASEVGVDLKQGYNGHLTSREAGSVGGQMVKNVLTVQLTKKVSFERENRIVCGRKTAVKYIVGVAV